MLKRLKVWSFMALALGASLYDLGCVGGNWLPWNTNAESWPRIITAILREDIFG